MKPLLYLAIALTVGLFTGGWLVHHGVFANEELDSKADWSVVQAVEAQHRDEPGDKTEIVKLDKYFLAGIPVPDARKMVWILLNPQNPPYYKQLPIGAYKLSKEDLKNIFAAVHVNSTVENCLESHVEAP